VGGAVRVERFAGMADRMWEEIPARYAAGIDAVLVDEAVVPHPDLSGVYTLGECLTDHWPDGYGEGETRSRIVLHHGSFAALSRASADFDWEAELWETLLHELLHHREFSASEEGLERYDEAVDQEFRRRAGRPFDPAFYRDVPAAEDGIVRIESEAFVEALVDPDARRAEFGWRGHRWSVAVPASRAVQYVRVLDLAGGRLWVVVWRRRPWWRRLFSGAEAGVEQLERRALPVPRPQGSTREG